MTRNTQLKFKKSKMHSKSIKYSFEHIAYCEMCGDDASNHHILGQRLNQSQGFKPKTKEGITVSVKKCTRCSLVYSAPMPIPFNIQDHYGVPPENYWKPTYLQWGKSYFSYELNVLEKLITFKPDMKALDVGAGIGKCMLSLQNWGFDAYGFEPSEPFYERAISKMNIPPGKIKLGMIEDVEYEKEYFDFITFGAVFEHLYHPAKSLAKAFEWLKPGGLIQIEVPSSDYLISKIVNGYYRLIGTNYVTNISPMHRPFHLYEFGKKSFYELAKKLNYDVVFSEYYAGGIGIIPKIFHPLLQAYMKQTNTGMQLTVWLKKK